MQDIEGAILALEDHLRAHPRDRAPVTHASTRIQLGMVLLQAGRLERAEEELAGAAEQLDPSVSPREHATALNLLGVVCRDTGRPELSGELFLRAAHTFGGIGATVEQGGCLHNVGLTLVDRDDPEGAAEAFREAGELLADEQVPIQRAANLRELGAALLQLDQANEAVALLERAADLSGRAGDLAGEGGAANTLGLAHLAREDADAAANAFTRALAANPRTIRPELHAMARANLALAHERAGDEPYARLAAAQADAIGTAPDAVREQARAILARLGPPSDDLHLVLDGLAEDGWERPVVDEVDRWSQVDDTVVAVALDGWLAGLATRDGQRVERTAVVLGRFLELPPEPMRRLIGLYVARAGELDPEAHDRVRAAVSRALARFPIPQWMRLKDVFVSAAGDEAWG